MATMLLSYYQAADWLVNSREVMCIIIRRQWLSNIAKWVCYHHTQELLSFYAKLIPDNTYLCVRLVVCSHYLLKCVSITCFSYWVLDHLHALPPNLGDNGRDVHHILQGSLLQSHVNSNQCACPPHTSTERREKHSTWHFDAKVLQPTHILLMHSLSPALHFQP